MEFTPLTPALRERFDADGFLILRGVLDRSTVDTLAAAGDRLIESNLQQYRQRSKDGLYDGFRNCIALDDAFMPLLMHPKVVPLVIQLMSPNVMLVTSH